MTDTTIETSSVSNNKTKLTDFDLSTLTTNRQYPLTLNYSDGYEFANSTASSTLIVESFSFKQLSDWSWKKYAKKNYSLVTPSIGSFTFTSPETNQSVTTDAFNCGRGHLAVLQHPIPVDKEYFHLWFVVKSGGSNNAFMLGGYTDNGSTFDITSSSLNTTFNSIGVNSTSTFYLVDLVFSNGTCTVTGNNTSTTKDFTSYTDDFYLMFFSAGASTLIVPSINWSYTDQQ